MSENEASTSPGTSGWYRAVAHWVDSEDPEIVRASGHAIAVFLVASGLGALSSAVHLAAGSPMRALFTGLYGLPLLIPLGLLRLSRRPLLATHLLLGLITIGLVVSPLLAESSIPIVLGLIVVPFAATAATNAAGGIGWTIVSLTILAAIAGLGPLTPAERTLAWTAVLVTASLAVFGFWIERARLDALRQANAQRDRAETEADTRARTEDALREQQTLLTTLFRRTPSMLILSDIGSGRILEVNEAFSKLSGWTRDQAIGRTLTELDAWPRLADRDQLKELLGASSMPEGIELQLKRKNGEPIDLLVSAEVIHVGGQPRLLAQGIDVSERKRAEEQLAHYHRELEERVQQSGEQLRRSMDRLEDQERLAAIGTLAAGIAHQINNPIGAISAVAEVSLLETEQDGEDDPRSEAMREIVQQARRCGQIVRSILQFSRNEPTVKWVEDLNPTVQRATRLARDYVESRGGRLDLRLHQGPLPILMSPIAIEQIVVNLVRNAAESRAGGVSIKLRTAIEDDWATLWIDDDGPGLSPEVRGRAFDPFFTTRLDDGGTGLGLSVAHGLVSDHAGEIAIETSSDEGVRIAVRLPLELDRKPEIMPSAR